MEAEQQQRRGAPVCSLVASPYLQARLARWGTQEAMLRLPVAGRVDEHLEQDNLLVLQGVVL